MTGTPDIAPVERSKREAQAWYDRIAGVYDRLVYPFERRAIRRCLDVAAVTPGETVLEIGSGTGHTLVELATTVGETGQTVGIDIAPRMVGRADAKLAASPMATGEAHLGDATALPYRDGTFDAVVMTFTLELFPEAELTTVLAECRRVLTDDGRLVVLSLADDGAMAQLYKRLHAWFPRAFDCRPLPLATLLEEKGWAIVEHRAGTLGGIPYSIVEARPGERF